jgi:hypothetical protein
MVLVALVVTLLGMLALGAYLALVYFILKLIDPRET